MKSNLKYYTIDKRNRMMRLMWRIVFVFFFRPSPQFCYRWRLFLLRMFGARVHLSAIVHPSVKIWAPWNLILDEGSCLSPHVDCYSVASVHLGKNSTVSQYSFLCTASHDYNSPSLPLVVAPIVIGVNAWVTADVFIGPGVHVGAGAVVLARSTVVSNVEPWDVVGGCPARHISTRPKFEI
jgi:putative colanic acid biosynthesis acetyltransferase WcaF